MAGREARVRRQVLEPGHVRPVAVDDPRRHAVGRRLHGDRRDEEGRDPPALEAGEACGDDADDDGDDDTARDDRADQRCLGPRRVPVCGEPADEALVGARDAAAPEHDIGQEQPQHDRERREQHVAQDRRDQEDRDRVAARERLGEALRRPARGRLERRNVDNCGAAAPIVLGSAGRSRHAIRNTERGLGHGGALPCSEPTETEPPTRRPSFSSSSPRCSIGGRRDQHGCRRASAPFRKSGALSADRLGVRGQDAGRPDGGAIGPTEDAATDTETPSGMCRDLRNGALARRHANVGFR